MPSTTILHQYSPSYDLPQTTVTTSNTISLPFTYYQTSPIKQFEYNNKTTNFDQISAWLDHTEIMTKEEQDQEDLVFIDENQQQSISSSLDEIDRQSKHHTFFLLYP